MLTVTLTPTMIIFENLEDKIAEALPDYVEVKVNEDGEYFAKGKLGDLYRVLLHLSYVYDIEIK